MKLPKIPFPRTTAGNVALFAIISIILAIVTIAFASEMTPRENAFLTIIVTILTTVVSWIMSQQSASQSHKELEAKTQEKIDTVAYQSSEKILNLSKQLFEIQRFIDETIDVADECESVIATNFTYRHRSDATAKMCSLLRSSNDTFTSDWIGVVSNEIAKRIEDQKRAQSEIFRGLESVRQGTKEEASGSENAEGLVRELNRLSNEASSLPESIRPDIRIPAVSVAQEITLASETIQTGFLTLTVMRPLYKTLGTGRLSPLMSAPPHMSVRLESSPAGVELPPIGIHSATGTRHDFHVHVKSNEYGVQLPVGRYRFHYRAEVVQRDQSQQSNDAIERVDSH